MRRVILLLSMVGLLGLAAAPSLASAQRFVLLPKPAPFPSPPRNVPELDPNGAPIALALLAGGVALVVERRRRANKA